MTTPCCINGYRAPRWVLDSENDRMKEAVARCNCAAGADAKARVFARLGIAKDDFAALKVACDQRADEVKASDHAEDAEAIAAWAKYAEDTKAARAAEADAEYRKVWAPRYAAGYVECTRCGGTGFVAPYGTCFRCEGHQVDPKKSKKKEATK